jgi:hypothetical protein
MGFIIEFQCPNCAYTDNVWSGAGGASGAKLDVKVCKTCQKVVGVLIGTWREQTKLSDKQSGLLRKCPVYLGEGLEDVVFDKGKFLIPCPKCQQSNLEEVSHGTFF